MYRSKSTYQELKRKYKILNYIDITDKIIRTMEEKILEDNEIRIAFSERTKDYILNGATVISMIL